MKLQTKKISIYCLVILGILLVSVIPVMAQDVNSAQNAVETTMAGSQNITRNHKRFPDYKRNRFRY